MGKFKLKRPQHKGPSGGGAPLRRLAESWDALAGNLEDAVASAHWQRDIVGRATADERQMAADALQGLIDAAMELKAVIEEN
jgi:hypothetical protein